MRTIASEATVTMAERQTWRRQRLATWIDWVWCAAVGSALVWLPHWGWSHRSVFLLVIVSTAVAQIVLRRSLPPWRVWVATLILTGLLFGLTAGPFINRMPQWSVIPVWVIALTCSLYATRKWMR